VFVYGFAVFPEFDFERLSHGGSRCRVGCAKWLWLALDSVRSTEVIVEVRVSTSERTNAPLVRCDVEVSSEFDKREFRNCSSISTQGNRKCCKQICALNCILVGLSLLGGSVYAEKMNRLDCFSWRMFKGFLV